MHIEKHLPPLAALLGVLVSATTVSASNDYCVACPDGSRIKVHNKLGGEVGMVIVGVSHPSCSVSYYDSRTCNEAGPRPGVAGAPSPPVMSSPAGQPRFGAAILRDRVVLEMSQEDFLRLVPELEKLDR